MKILLINLNHIGDVLFTLPAVDELLHAMPETEIVHLVCDATLPLVKDDPRFLEVVPRPKTGFREWARIAGDLRRRHRFDAAICFSRNSPGLGYVAWRSGAPVRVGFEGTWDARPFFNRRVPYDETFHRVERNAALLEPLGISLERPRIMGLYLSDPLRAWARDALADLPGEGPRIALCMGASVERKKWPTARFIELTGRLHQEMDARFVLIGGPEDAVLAEVFAREANVPFRSFCGTVGVMESAALLAACDLAVGADTGPTHLAVSVDTPIVALYGSSEPLETGPYEARGTTVFHRLPCCGCSLSVPCPIGVRCMAEITVEEVQEAILETLEEVESDSEADARIDFEEPPCPGRS